MHTKYINNIHETSQLIGPVPVEYITGLIPRVEDGKHHPDCVNFIPYRDGYLIHWGFSSFTVKYLAIECYYGGNDYGIDLYEKLSGIRKGDFVKRFLPVIKSFEQLGFQPRLADISIIPQSTEQKGMIANGSHTIMCCIYFGVDKLYYREVLHLNESYDKLRCLEKGIPSIITDTEKLLISQEMTRVESYIFC